MSGGKKEDGNDRRSILGEFSAAHKKEFEVWKERDFEQTTKSLAEMRGHQLFEENNLKQKLIAEKDAIGHISQNLPSYSLVQSDGDNAKNRYHEIMKHNEESKFQLDVKYSNLRDQIRGDGETLEEIFTDQSLPPELEFEDKISDMEQLGIDTQVEFNISADISYYGTQVGYDYDPDANPFTEEFNLNSYGEDDFISPDNGDDHGNDGGGRGM